MSWSPAAWTSCRREAKCRCISPVRALSKQVKRARRQFQAARLRGKRDKRRSRVAHHLRKAAPLPAILANPPLVVANQVNESVPNFHSSADRDIAAHAG